MKDFPLPAISTATTYMKFNNADPREMLAKDLIVQMYEGLECPIVCFTRDGHTLMAVPPTIRRVFHSENEPQSTQA